jgi:hypothetical protein
MGPNHIVTFYKNVVHKSIILLHFNENGIKMAFDIVPGIAHNEVKGMVD